MAKRTVKISSLLQAFGLYHLLVCIYEFFKYVNERTNTEILSDEIYHKLQDNRNLEILNKEICNYHKTGYWNDFELF